MARNSPTSAQSIDAAGSTSVRSRGAPPCCYYPQESRLTHVAYGHRSQQDGGRSTGREAGRIRPRSSGELTGEVSIDSAMRDRETLYAAPPPGKKPLAGTGL